MLENTALGPNKKSMYNVTHDSVQQQASSSGRLHHASTQPTSLSSSYFTQGSHEAVLQPLADNTFVSCDVSCAPCTQTHCHMAQAVRTSSCTRQVKSMHAWYTPLCLMLLQKNLKQTGSTWPAAVPQAAIHTQRHPSYTILQLSGPWPDLQSCARSAPLSTCRYCTHTLSNSQHNKLWSANHILQPPKSTKK